VYRRRYESRRSPKPCIKKNKIRRKRFSIGLWRMDSFILQCGRWLWDDMLLNSPKHLPYWNPNSTYDFDFDHITAVDMSFCTSLRKFVQIGPPTAGKNDVMSIFKTADLRYLGLYGFNNGFFEKSIYDFLIHSARISCHRSRVVGLLQIVAVSNL